MKFGEIQDLTMVKQVDFGVYLADAETCSAHSTAGQTAAGKRSTHGTAGNDRRKTHGTAPADRVLLPKAQVPEGLSIGDTISVFVYKDSEDRPIATTRMPKLTIGGLAVLSVKQVTGIGAFLDWGLEKDLFLPYRQQIGKPKAGDQILVTLYLDKSERLCASMRGLYPLLSTDSPYKTGDEVSARIYEFSKNFGTFAAVDDLYSALIPVHEDTGSLHPGQVIRARVTNRKPDGKLDLSIREKAFLQIDRDAETVLKLLESCNGILPFSDKASPEQIREEAKMSKNAFKRAVGKLYKERQIEILPDRIILKRQS